MENVILPEIQLNEGTNTISINTNITPSYFMLRYNKNEAGIVEEEISVDEYFENKPNNEVKPISAITLRSSEVRAAGQTVYDDELIEEYGLNELIIEEDYIAYTDTLRNTFLEAAKELFGLTYKPLTVQLLGNVYLDFNDIIEITNLQQEKHKTFALNNTHEYNGTLYNTISVPALTETEERYKYETEDKTFRRKTAIEIDKANQQIQSIVSEIGDRSEKQTTITQDLDRIQIAISDIEDLTLEVTGNNPITLENCLEGELVQLRIIGNNSVFAGLTPATVWLMPSNSLYPRGDSILILKHYEVDENNQEIETIETIDLGITEALRQYSSTIYDEFVYNYDAEDYKAKVIRRVGVTPGHVTYPLSEEIIEPVLIDDIILTKGKNIIDIGSSYTANCYARYVQVTDFTKQFATTYEVQSYITQLANSITLLVQEKVNKNEVIAQLNLEISEGVGIVRIEGNQVIIDSDNFHLEADGTITAKEGNIAGFRMWRKSNGSFLTHDVTRNEVLYRSGFGLYNNNINFIFAGMEVDEVDPDAMNFTDVPLKINMDGSMQVERITFNGQSGKTDILFDNNAIAMSLRWDGIYRYLSNGNFWAKWGTLFNGSIEDGEGVIIRDAQYFSIYDDLHIVELARFSRVGNQGEASRIDFRTTSYVNGYQIQTAQSDARIKDNIDDCEIEALPILNKIPMRQFDWNKEKSGNEGHVDIGFIAQEVEQEYDKLVIHSINPDNDTYGIDLLNTLALSVKAIQELSKKVDDLEEEINKLKEEK